MCVTGIMQRREPASMCGERDHAAKRACLPGCDAGVRVNVDNAGMVGGEEEDTLHMPP